MIDKERDGHTHPSHCDRRTNTVWFKRFIQVACVLSCVFVALQTSRNIYDWHHVRSLQRGYIAIASPWLEDAQLTRAHHILKHNPLIDTHIDLPELARWLNKNKINDGFDFDKPDFFGHLDIPRLREGRVGGAFWSVYTDCPSDWNQTSGPGTLEAVRTTLQQIDVTKRIIGKYSKDMTLVRSPKEFMKSFKRGKITGVMGAEGLHQIGNSAAALRLYHDLGVRYITLTHFCNNAFADSCSVPPWHDGLSKVGKQIITEMNRVGMIVDLSHTSDDTMRDALKHSTAPVIFSHSGARGVFAHERNAPDDVLDALKHNGGVINIVFMAEYLAKDYKAVSIDTVVDHVLYIVDRIGWAHIGIGSDFDGTQHLPEGLESVAKYPDLIKRIFERAPQTKDADIIGFIGGNVLRVWRQVERESAKLRKNGLLPLELDEV